MATLPISSCSFHFWQSFCTTIYFYDWHGPIYIRDPLLQRDGQDPVCSCTTSEIGSRLVSTLSNQKWRTVCNIDKQNPLLLQAHYITELKKFNRTGRMLLKRALLTSGRRCFILASTSALSSRRRVCSPKLASLRSPTDTFKRSFSSSTEKPFPAHTMEAWHVHEYGSNDVLELGRQPLPSLRKPTDVLVRIHAASVNPIDYRMRSGYGETLLNVWRKLENVEEFPLILGRDFSGEVVKTGRLARRFRKGDEVSCIQSDSSTKVVRGEGMPQSRITRHLSLKPRITYAFYY